LERIIFHVDVNSAFLSWEAAYRLHHLGASVDLRQIPSAVAGDAESRHGIILAKSHPAKKYGVCTGETIGQARVKCPQLYMVPPNYSLYQRCSRAFQEILKEYTPDVEPYSIDECYMDMTETLHLFGKPLETADEIRGRIERELGFTVNIGVASNKLLAKMASEFRKPNYTHSLFPWEIQEKMWPLPISQLFFVGRAARRKLEMLGISTIGELAAADPAFLKPILHKHGEQIWNFANGRDSTEVRAEAPVNKGFGNSTTVAFDVKDRGTARKVLLALAETVGSRLRSHKVKAEVIAVGIKSYDFHYSSHQMVMPNPTNITWELYQYACQLFDQLWDKKTPLRHLGIHTQRIRDGAEPRQMNLFDNGNYEKLEKLDKTIDVIRRKYGIDAVKRAVFLEGAIDHLSGGISREKRTVDYSRQKIE